jgi:D-alanyl-D-alanine carboxypeptidase
MIKKLLLWVLLPLLVIVAGAIGWAYWYVKPDANRIVAFIKKHPKKSALLIRWNQKTIGKLHEDTLMPAASVSKLWVAIAFAHQAAAGIINLNEEVDTNALLIYYFPETDGGAHPDWVAAIKKEGLMKEGKVALIDVAKGMMRFSSNANTEYLFQKLGLKNINQLKDSLGFAAHTPMYPFISALLVLQNHDKLDYKKYVAQKDLMTAEEYMHACDSFHRILQNNPRIKESFTSAEVDLKVQRIWSNRLPGGSPKLYALLLEKLNNRTLLDSLGHSILSTIIEQNRKDTAYASHFKHYGYKGGSTAYVLAQMAYCTDKQNNKGELAVFFNNLTTLENLKLQTSLPDFEFRLFTDSIFRNQLKQLLIK